jgi:hypothetical protein
MDREERLAHITQGSPWDDAHIQHCLALTENEPDDLVRVYARLWLERHSITLAQRVLGLQTTPQ